jgi:C_GCAxxG_C_C family probable redox protein
MKDPVEIASAYSDRGFSCAQSVFAAFAVRNGLEEATALKLASTLGGGLSRHGEVCGAVSGALLALGLALGSDRPEGKEESYRRGDDFLKRFQHIHGTLLCRELINFDLHTPEGLELARASGVLKTRCPVFVRDAAAIVAAMLDEHGRGDPV